MRYGLILVAAGLLVLSLLGGAFYIVSETQQVVITQFGRPVGEPITEAQNPDHLIEPFLIVVCACNQQRQQHVLLGRR